jgi:hypothetical protein
MRCRAGARRTCTIRDDAGLGIVDANSDERPDEHFAELFAHGLVDALQVELASERL